MKNTYLTIIAVAFYLTSFAGGPWLWKKKTGYMQLQLNQPAYRYKALLAGSINETIPINRYIYDSDYSLFAEHGLTDKLNFMFRLPIKYVSAGKLTDSKHFENVLDEGSLFGLGNIDFGLKYGIIDKKVKGAISVQTSWKTSKRDLNKGLSTGYDANAVGLFGHFGGSLSPKIYAFGEAGYRYYSNNFSDMIEAHFEIGYQVISPVTLMFLADVRQSLKNGSNFDERRLQTGLYTNNQQWVVASLKAVYESKKNIGASLGFPLIPVKIENVGFAGAFAFGVFKKFN